MDVLLPFAKNLVPFRDLELHKELLKDTNPTIQNCQGKR
jgi:hypothetical protein